MKIVRWAGYHSQELLDLVAQAWEGEILLKVGSPAVQFGEETTWNNGDSSSRPILAVTTSGTTAQPRWVYYSKENIESSLAGITSLFDLNRIDTIFCYPQPFHTFGLTLGYVLALRNGFRLVTPDGKYSTMAHAKRVDLKSENVLTLGTPVHFWDLKKFIQKEGKTLTPSYSAIVGGAPVSVDLWQSLKDDLKISAPSIGYGCTEASPGLTHLPPGESPRQDFEIGYPLPGVDLQVIDGIGVEFSGANVCMAYESAGKVARNKKMIIKDHLEVDERGCFRFIKRHDLVINSGGQKLSIESIEKSIRDKLSVEVLACAVSDIRLGEDLGLWVKSHDQAVIEKIEKLIFQEFGKRINQEHIRLTHHFPLNFNGKLDRVMAAQCLQVKWPIDVKAFADWTPHRQPMVWVDRICSVTSEEGFCEVDLKSNGLYMSDGSLRLSSLVEFVAQSSAYVRAAQCTYGYTQLAKKPKRAFLVGTRDTQFFVEENDPRLSPGKTLTIRIFDIRNLSSFEVYSAEMKTVSGDVLMSAKMKVFHE